MAATHVGIQEPAGASQTAKLDAWSIDRGGTTFLREVMVIGGSATNDLLFGTSGVPAAGAIGLPVWPINSSGAVTSGNPLHVFMQGSTATQTVQGNVSAAISGNTTAVVANSSGGIASGNPLHVFVQGSTATVTIQGNTSAVVANSSGGISTGNPLAVFLQGSTATVTIQGNATAILTTGSKVQVEGIAGAVFPISGNATVTVGTGTPAYIAYGGTSASGGFVAMGADGTATNSTARPLHVNASQELKTVAAISGNATAVVANTSGAVTTANPLAVLIQGSTATVSVQGNVSAAISGNATAVISNTSGNITTANPLAVLLQGSTATVTVQGNVSAAVAGNVSAVVTALPGNVQINTTAGSTALLVAGADGNTSNSTARVLKVNASQELIVTGAVTVAGNTSVQGNVSAVVANTSGSITTANPLAIFLQGSTATVSIQGNVSAAISGNATVAISTATPAYIAFNGTTASGGFVAMGLDGTATNSTARPLQVNSSGELRTVAAVTVGGLVQINTTGGSTMMLVGGMDGNTSNSTARPLRVNSSGELLTVGGTVTLGGLAQINTTGGSTMMIVGGMDGGTSNSTARALRVDASGKLLVDAAVTIGGIVQINATAGSTALLIAGADGNTSNSTARALQVNASQELIVKGTIVGNTSVVGNVSAIITTAQAIQVEPKSGAAFAISTATPAYIGTTGTTASGGFLSMGLDSTAAGATARPLKVNASQELIIAGAVSVVGNASVVGNVSAIITTAQKIQTEPIAGAVFPISGNASVVITTAWPAYIAFNGTTASGGVVMMGLDGTATNSTARPLQVDASGKLKVDAGSISVGGLAQVGATGGSTMMLVGGADGTSSNSTARFLQVNASQELIVKGTIVGNTSVVGNVSAVISGNATAVISNTSGNITTANPLAVLLQGSTATVTVQGNVSAAVAGNVSAVVTAMPGAVQLQTTAGTTGLLIFGADGTSSNSTVRPLQVNASQELLIRGAVTISGNSTAIITTGSKVQVEGIAGAVFPISGNATVAISTGTPAYIAYGGASASGGFISMGADGTATNSTARPIKVNASQELVITGNVTVVGNATVQGNVSAVISGNATAVISNTSGNITTANPLAVLLQGSTATVSIQGNATAIITTGSKVQVEPIAGATFPISGNASISAAAVLPVGQVMNQVYQGTTALTPQYANFAASASGLLSVVSSVTGRIVVLAAQLTVLTSCSIRWYSSAANALTGLMPIGERSGFVLPFNPVGWFRTATGEALQLDLVSATGPLGGSIVYCVPST